MSPGSVWCHRGMSVLFLMVFGVSGISVAFFSPMDFTIRAQWNAEWTQAVWWSAVLTLIAGWARRVPLQNLLAVAAISAGLGWLAGRVLSVPPHWDLQFVGPVIALGLGHRGAARWIFRSRRGRNDFGVRVLILSVVLSLVLLELPILRHALIGGTLSANVGGISFRFPVLGLWTSLLIGLHLASASWLLDKRSPLPWTDVHPAWVMLLMLIWQALVPSGFPG